ISIETQFNVSQAQPLAQGGQTVVVPEQKVTAQEQKSNFVTLGRGATVDELIRALNALGVTPRDTIAILEALKTAGALQAELEIIRFQTSQASPALGERRTRKRLPRKSRACTRKACRR